MEKEKKESKISRRNFIGNVAATTAGITILPSYVVGGLGHTPPSDKLNIAGVGVGGMGRSNINNLNSENIVALCDVDWEYAAKCFKDYPNAKQYKDYRKMLDEMKDSIDAVVIATPDHTHAIITTASMSLGKHVYVQKPLTHSVYESRVLREMAKEYKVATQMGNQGNSGEGIRKTCEWIWDGAIGEIERVHAWTNRPIWPQGLERPAEMPPVPETLAWDLFIGTAPYRPYHPAYTPWNWRAWWDFGTGALGDMACHILDPAFWALNLGHPIAVQGSSTQLNTESAPHASVIHYEFPEREKIGNTNMRPVKLTWYDGGLLPKRPEELEDGIVLGNDPGGGVIFVGTKGKLMCGCYGRNPVLLPKSLMEEYEEPPKTLRRIEKAMGGGHEMDWVRACKESPENRVLTSSNFDYSGPLNEMVVMGNLAIRLQNLRRKLLWDGENMKITNISDSDMMSVVTTDKFEVVDGDPKWDTKRIRIPAKAAAEEYIKHNYREGWSL